MKHCDLSVGDWFIIEGCYAYVLAVHDIYYEVFHLEVLDDGCKQGDYNYSLVAYRIYCTLKGKRINRRPTYFWYGIEEWQNLYYVEKEFLEKLLESDPDGFNRWKEGSVSPTEYEHIDIPVVSAKPKSVMNKFKKAIKQLSAPFTFADLMEVCQDIESMDWSHINEVDNNYIVFNLTFTIGRHKGKCILFDKIKNIEYVDTEEEKRILESFFTFESCFLSLATFVNAYNCSYPSEKNVVLLSRLKEIWSGLFNHNWKEQPLAHDFFIHASKKMSYSFELAYSTVLGFLERNVQELDCQRLVDFLLEEERDRKLYRRAYEHMIGIAKSAVN